MMRSIRLGVLFVIIGLYVPFNLQAQIVLENSDTVVVIDQFTNFFQYRNFYLTGQPSLEALEWLKSENVVKIINLRTEEENKKYAETAYDEKIVIKKMGFEYYSLPVNGIEGYTSENLENFINLLNKDEKIVIHCRSATRVTDFFMAYLINKEGYSINEAVKIGRKIKFHLPLEVLLGREIDMRIDK